MPDRTLPLSAQIVYEAWHAKRDRRAPKTFPGRQCAVITGQRASFQPSFPTIRALGSALFFETYCSDSSFLSSAQKYFEENPLIAATLKPATQEKYGIALENFKTSRVANEESQLSLDQRLSIYIQGRYLADTRARQRQEMANLLCMLLLMYPSLRHELGLARRCISGWKSLKPAKSSAPFTKEMVLALMWSMLKDNRVPSATVLFISFSACLRVSEALHLKWENLALPGDLRLAPYPEGTAGLNIADAKTSRYTGKLQFVKLADKHAIKFLFELKQHTQNLRGRIAPIEYQRYSADLQKALADFELDPTIFTSHSARIGKATEAFIEGDDPQQIAKKRQMEVSQFVAILPQ